MSTKTVPTTGPHLPAHLAPPDLPDPHERPQADVVIFDGSCPLCTTACRWLERLDGRARLAYVSLYDPRVGVWYPDLPREELLEHVYVIEPAGRRHAGAGVLRYLSRRIPALWPLVPLLHFPGSRPLWSRAYQAFSRHRHRLSRLVGLKG